MKRMCRAGATVIAAVLLGSCACSRPPLADDERENQEVVVLLHGLGRTDRSMNRMECALGAAGYMVHSLRYPSTKRSVEDIAEQDLAPLLVQCQASKPARIHFVAHSMGNIVIRQYLATHEMEQAGRIVMLAPPSQGSEVVDKLGCLNLFGWLYGPAGRQLGTDRDSLPNRLPAPRGEVGVIAGTRTINWILSSLIPGPDDGSVAVERTRLEGMTDFTTVEASHTFIMRNREVIDLTLSFLEHGSFALDQ